MLTILLQTNRQSDNLFTRMAGMMRVVAGLMVSLSAPRGPINRKYTFLRRILLVQDGPEDARAAKETAKHGMFGSL